MKARHWWQRACPYRWDDPRREEPGYNHWHTHCCRMEGAGKPHTHVCDCGVTTTLIPPTEGA